MFVLRAGKGYHFHGNFSSKMVTFSARNTNIHKIWKLHRAIFLPPNFLTVTKDLPRSKVRSIMQIAINKARSDQV